MKKDSIGYVVLFTFVACVVFIVPLALANEVTKAKVEANRLFAAHSAVLRAFGLGYRDAREVEAKYSSLVKELPGGRGWTAELDGRTWMALRKTGPGLWGSISIVVAADAAGTELRGIEVLDQQETPGLGGRIDEPWFKEQFRGEKLAAEGLALAPAGSGKGDADHGNASIDAVTGASLTSGFVRTIVNAAIADIKAMGGAK